MFYLEVQSAKCKVQSAKCKVQSAKCKVQSAKRESGFTLVELSIVIVIIGLIVAGVVGGQSLVKTSKMNAQIADLAKFEVAYNAFKLEYDAIPGDMKNASSYWAGATDGDGNGRITHTADDGYNITRENINFFEHLSRAKLVNENYTNVLAINIGYPSLKINSGKGMIAGSGVRNSVGAQCQLSNSAAALRTVATLFLQVSNPLGDYNTFNDFVGTASPLTLSTIDKKIDDGVARTGKFKSHRVTLSIVGNCLTGVDGNYLITETRDTCMGEFIIAK